jgi:phosphoserine phosphatase
MRGEISDYKESLARRLELLAGTPVSALQRVYEHRLRLHPGVLKLLAYARWDGLKILLVSGGFTYFTDRLRPRLGLDYAVSNELEIEDGVMTGRVLGRIVDGQAKRDAVAQACIDIGCSHEQVIAVGDGANDLPMMQLAGLSVAYRAKPKVREYANVSIDTGGLNRLLEVIVPSVAYR